MSKSAEHKKDEPEAQVSDAFLCVRFSDQGWQERSALSGLVRYCDLDNKVEWRAEVDQILDDQGAKILVVWNGCAEAEVSRICLHGLHLGMDVILIADHLTYRDEHFSDLILSRLRQFGVIVTTETQFRLEHDFE